MSQATGEMKPNAMGFGRRDEVIAVERALAVAAATQKSGPVRAATERAVVDALSVALAGARHPRLAVLRERMVGLPIGETRVWASAARDAQTAALLNGIAIHAYDFDDTHDEAIVHAMAVILPAAFAGAEMVASGSRLLAAVAGGTELACNLALAAGGYGGWHYTTLCGTLGAALACAVASGAGDSQVAEAVGNAFVFAAGNKQAVLDSSQMKRVMPGFAARNGVLAALAAESGLGGVRGWLTGDMGLVKLFYGGSARLHACQGGDRARVEELSFKPIPACRFTHGAVEAAQRLRAHTPADELERLLSAHPVRVHYPALDRFAIVCRRYERRGEAEMDAQFSTGYLVATALRLGEVSFASYTPAALADRETEALAQRVNTVCDLPVAHDRALAPIEVSIGPRTERVDHVLGSAQRPMGEDDHRRKLITCIEKARAERVGAPVAHAAWHNLREAVHGLDRDGGPVALLDRLDAIAERAPGG